MDNAVTGLEKSLKLLLREIYGPFFPCSVRIDFLHSLLDRPGGDVIILNNTLFHRKKRLYEIAERHNVKIIFLPPYSPELNPIEHFWHWLKKMTADMLKKCLNLSIAIFTAFQMW